MTNRAVDPNVLHDQYNNSEKLVIRQEAHRLYSERRDDFLAWLLGFLAPQPGDRVADVGSGHGAIHPQLAQRGVQIVALDLSHGMVREARAQAVEQNLPVVAVQADAQRLPLVDGCCDRVMANHMLYHVPDQMAALREIRRVLKPGGRVVLATNSAHTYPELYELHDAAVAELGYTRDSGSLSTAFSLADIERVRQVFPSARVEERRDALLFPTADAALRYYASGHIDRIADAPADNSHRARLLPVVAEKVQKIIDREGVFRVAKGTGCFVAEKEQ